MKIKKTIAEQVAELTQEQQDKVYKYGLVSLIIEIVIGIPFMIYCFYGIWTIYGGLLGFADVKVDSGFALDMIIYAVGLVFFLGMFLFIKIRCPHYSDRKWWYIRKMRKQNKQ